MSDNKEYEPRQWFIDLPEDASITSEDVLTEEEQIKSMVESIPERLSLTPIENHSNTTEKERRMSICNNCDENVEVLTLRQCNLCGCFLKLKTSFKNSVCPIDKW
jgi:hypothetical protein